MRNICAVITEHTGDLHWEAIRTATIWHSSTSHTSAKRNRHKSNFNKSMMYPLHALRYAKMHKSGRSDVEKWKSLACNDVIHFLVWKHQPSNQSIEINFNNFFFKFITVFWADLRTLLSLILPSQYCQGAVRLVSGQYFFLWKGANFMDP